MANSDFLTQAIEWTKAGRRSVTIEIESPYYSESGIKETAWFYDFDVMAGQLIKVGEPIPNVESMAAEKARQIEKELDTLKQGKVLRLERELENLKTRKEAANV